MDARELLKGTSAGLPKSAREQPFRKALQFAFDSYLADVDRLSGSDHATITIRSARGAIRALSCDLLRALEFALQGQPSKARSQLEQAIAGVRSHLDLLVTPLVEGGIVRVLFRIRVAEAFEELHRGDLFHIPFQLRHRVAPQRYSVLGVPMLYLGSSLYVCWEELGRPELNRAWVSAFRVREGQQLRILNFGDRPEHVGRRVHDPTKPATEDCIAAYGIVWPLIAACSFRALERNAPFVEEYTIPPLLMSWLTESEEYFSTHVKPLQAHGVGRNIVLPARSLVDEGYCSHLAKLLESTQPVPWALVSQLERVERPPVYGDDNALQVVPGRNVPYAWTEFALMEVLLKRYQFAQIC